MAAGLDVDLSAAMGQVRRGLVVTPVLKHYIAQADELRWPEMSARSFSDRPPDGWFHPSTHPSWSPAALYTYLARPDLIVSERRGYSEVMSLLFGTAAHLFFQEGMRQAGMLPPELQVCTLCPPEAGCQEPSWEDPETGERGHADGRLDASTLWELKTTSERHLRGVEDLDTEAFIAKIGAQWGYDHQGWRYQHLSGARRTIFTVVALGNPWLMREFHLDYDEEQAERVSEKYRRVRRAVAERQPPRCSCLAGARIGCPGQVMCS